MTQDEQDNIDYLISHGFAYSKENEWYQSDKLHIIVSVEMARFTYPTAFKIHVGNLIKKIL